MTSPSDLHVENQIPHNPVNLAAVRPQKGNGQDHSADALSALYALPPTDQGPELGGDLPRAPEPSQEVPEGFLDADDSDPVLDQSGLFKRWETAADNLPKGDFPALEEWIKGVLMSGLPEYKLNSLFIIVRKPSGFKAKIIDDTVKACRNQMHAVLNHGKPQMAKRREVFIKGQNALWDPHSEQVLSVEAFVNATARCFGGDTARVRDECLYSPNALCDYAEQLTYDPGLSPGITMDDRGVRVFNTFEGLGSMPMQGNVQPFLDLLDRLEMEDAEKTREHVLNWIGFMLQNPGVKINHGMMFGGLTGIGKSMLAKTVCWIVGKRNSKTIDGKLLGSTDFNEYYARAKFIVFEEVMLGGRKDVPNTVKTAMAAPPDDIAINGKNQRLFWIPNKVQCFLLTNFAHPMDLDPDERRICCIWCDARAPREDDTQAAEDHSAFWNRYVPWLEGNGYRHLQDFFLRRDLSGFDPGKRPPMTEWKRRITKGSTGRIGELLRDLIERRAGPFALEVAKLRHIQAAVLAAVNSQAQRFAGHVESRDLAAALQEVGCVTRVWRDRGANGPKHNLWLLRPGSPDATTLDKCSNRNRVFILDALPEPGAGDYSKAIERQRQVIQEARNPSWI